MRSRRRVSLFEHVQALGQRTPDRCCAVFHRVFEVQPHVGERRAELVGGLGDERVPRRSATRCWVMSSMVMSAGRASLRRSGRT